MSQVPTKSKKRSRNEAWRAARISALLLLRERFPQTFARLNAQTRRPLKVGIHAEIAAALPDLSAVEVKRALQFYARDVRYHAACIEGAERIGLDGKVAGTVATAEAEHAKRAIAAIEAKLERHRERRTAPTPSSPSPPKRLSLSDLRAAASARKTLNTGANHAD
jgi:sRNA-binding protein